jgi:ribosome-associated protein
LASLAARLAEEKKALDTTVLQVSDVSPLADYFVICSGESMAQIRAISQAIRDHFKSLGLTLQGEDADKASRWHLLDYGDVVIHVLHPEERHFYRLEAFWSHADRVPEQRWQGRQAS